MTNFADKSFAGRNLIDEVGLTDTFKANAGIVLSELNSVNHIETFFIGESNTQPIAYPSTTDDYVQFPFSSNVTFSNSNPNLFTFDKNTAEITINSFRGKFGFIFLTCDMYGADADSHLQGFRIIGTTPDGKSGPIAQSLITTSGTNTRFSTSLIARPNSFTLEEDYNTLTFSKVQFMVHAKDTTARFVGFKAFGIFSV